MTIAAGTKLGTYEVVAQIGAGGMGEVYRAHDSKLGRDVAFPNVHARSLTSHVIHLRVLLVFCVQASRMYV